MSFDPKNVSCPHCKSSNLWPIEDGKNIIAYKCIYGCGSVFDTAFITDFKQGIVYYLVKRRNPDYRAELNSDKVLENYKKTKELDSIGVPFYTDIYVIGHKRFDEGKKDE